MPDAPFGTIYLGAPIELASERMVIAALAKRLDQDQAPYVVIANAQIGGRQIDCLVQVWLICSMTLRGRSSIGWNPTGSNFIRRRRSSGSPLWAAIQPCARAAEARIAARCRSTSPIVQTSR